jgi:chromosome segregation ATPase
MTTWKQRKQVAKRQKVLTLGLVVLTFLAGSVVSYSWGSKHSKVNQVTAELERTQFELANATVALEKASKIAGIRTNIEAVLLEILDVYSQQRKRVEVAEKHTNKKTRDKAQRELEMMWEAEFSPLQDQLTQLEQTLSELENREPRNFGLPVMEPFTHNVMRR